MRGDTVLQNRLGTFITVSSRLVIVSSRCLFRIPSSCRRTELRAHDQTPWGVNKHETMEGERIGKAAPNSWGNILTPSSTFEPFREVSLSSMTSNSSFIQQLMLICWCFVRFVYNEGLFCFDFLSVFFGGGRKTRIFVFWSPICGNTVRETESGCYGNKELRKLPSWVKCKQCAYHVHNTRNMQSSTLLIR